MGIEMPLVAAESLNRPVGTVSTGGFD